MSAITYTTNTREHHIRMARIYLHQARCTIHRDWKFTLLDWAAERRLMAARIRPTIAKQGDLFGG
jgi:hypothetical protein